MTKKQKEIFGWTVSQLRKACKEMGFKFKLSKSLDNRYDLITDELNCGIGFGFKLDGVEYFISQYKAPKFVGPPISKETDTFYFGAVIVQYPGSFEESPSEDYREVTQKGSHYRKPQDVIPSILRAHSDWCLNMVIEGLMGDEQEQEFLAEERGD